MLYEFHILKNYPPTNLNRDESGAPKTCQFADTSRARISSQCLKHSWRTSELFKDAVGPENLGIRTRHLPELVSDELLSQGADPEWVKIIVPQIAGLFSNKETAGKITKQIVLYAPDDIRAVAQGVQELFKKCQKAADVKKLKPADIRAVITDAQVRPITVDIALFGRMVTSENFADIEAAMQVAHAISTNKVLPESDFFTAVDDLVTGDALSEQGSGMMGDVDYNSSCYYIYAALDTDALMDNLKHTPEAAEIVRRTIPALLRTMGYVSPSGKQNTFAGHVLPSAVLVEAKKQKIPVSLVNAFTEPARTDHKGDMVTHSIEKMRDELDSMSADYGIPVTNRWWFTPERYREITPDSDTTICETFEELVEHVGAVAGEPNE